MKLPRVGTSKVLADALFKFHGNCQNILYRNISVSLHAYIYTRVFACMCTQKASTTQPRLHVNITNRGNCRREALPVGLC